MTMRFLSPEDLQTVFGSVGFSVSAENLDYRTALTLDGEIAAAQMRVGASPPDHWRRLAPFLEEANRWLPSEADRLLWVDHFECAVGGGTMRSYRLCAEASESNAISPWLPATTSVPSHGINKISH